MLLSFKHNMDHSKIKHHRLPRITHGVSLGPELRLISVRSCTKRGSLRKASVSETLMPQQFCLGQRRTDQCVRVSCWWIWHWETPLGFSDFPSPRQARADRFSLPACAHGNPSLLRPKHSTNNA